MKKAIRVLYSLQFAIFILITLTISLIVATVMESLYDTPTAQYWVYRSTWFYLLLFALGVNIFAVAVSRWPWEKRHIPFLTAHLGILILLVGSWVTDRKGLDGSMRVMEGETSSTVELNAPLLVLAEGDRVNTRPIEWLPPNAEFKPIELKEYGLIIDKYITHADHSIDFVAAPADEPGAYPAIKIKLAADPKALKDPKRPLPPMMRIGMESWLWEGDPTSKAVQAGPARLSIDSIGSGAPGLPPGHPGGMPNGPQFKMKVEGNGDLSYVAIGSDGKSRKGRIPREKIKGSVIDPGWKMPVQLTVLEWVPRALSEISYKPSRVQYGTNTSYSAIHLVANKKSETSSGKKADAEIWLGLGDRATLTHQGRQISIGYFPKRVVLPYSLKLHRFRIDHYEGTRNPMEFSSVVSVVDQSGGSAKLEQPETLISMNEPLTYKGVTFYQASYEDAEPRPTVSIFSVNQDPGRAMKYLGSLLIVLGAIMLFSVKYLKARTGRRARSSASAQVPVRTPPSVSEVNL